MRVHKVRKNMEASNACKKRRHVRDVKEGGT